MIVAAVVIDKLSILSLIDIAQVHRNRGEALAVLPDGTMGSNRKAYEDKYPEECLIPLWNGDRHEMFRFKRAGLVAQSRRAFVYHLGEDEAERWRVGSWKLDQRKTP